MKAIHWNQGLRGRGTFLLATLLLFLFAVAPAAQASTCLKDLAALNENAETLRVEAAGFAFADSIDAEIHRGSDRTKTSIRSANASHTPVVIDYVGVGGGPLNAIAFSTLRAYDPQGTRLVFEASDSLGTFQKMPDFDVNTVELPNDSWNVFPGVPIQTTQLNPAGRRFVPARTFGAETALAYHSSQTPVIFGEKARITKEPKGAHWPAPYRIETGNGLMVYARNVLWGTGLGEPATKLSDPQSLAHIAEEKAKRDEALRRGDIHYAPGLQTVDDFLATTAKDRAAGRKPLARYPEGSTFAVIGSYDGGRIAIEELLREKTHEGKIHWIGQTVTGANVFREMLAGFRLERYGRIADNWDQLSTGDGHLQRIEKIVSSVNGKPRVQWRLIYDGPGGGVPGPVVDHVIFATGYKNVAKQALEGLSSPAGAEPPSPTELSPITVDRSDFTHVPFQNPTTIGGAQVKSNGKTDDIYALGAATGIGQSDEERARGFLGTAGASTAALARDIAIRNRDKRGSLPPPTLRSKAGEKRYLLVQIAKPSHAQGETRTPEATLNLRLRFAEALGAFSVSSSRPLEVSFHSIGAGRISVKIAGLDPLSARLVEEKLARNLPLLNALSNAIRTNEGPLTFRVPVRSDGMLRFEDLEVSFPVTR